MYESALPAGARNSISDVDGVTVGHYTLISGEGAADPGWRPGNGPYRTGVTVILPHAGNLYDEKVAAAVHTINGFSAHAGRSSLIAWRGKVAAPKTFLVHGELPAMQALKDALPGDVSMPKIGEEATI